MAILLNLETATTNCSVSAAKDGTILALKEYNSGGYSHSEKLHLFIEEVLAEASLTMQDVEAVAVSKGPGSYTGLRIGVSAAKGLCFALQIPLIAIATLESMAHQVTDFKGYIIPLLDARRMEVYAQAFNEAYTPVGETKAEIITEESFLSYAEEQPVMLVGSGAEKCKEVLKHPNFKFLTTVVPSAREMAALSNKKFKENDFEDVAYFEPYYLKDFILQTKKKA